MYLPKAIISNPHQTDPVEVIEEFLQWLAELCGQFVEPLGDLYYACLGWLVHVARAPWEWLVCELRDSWFWVHELLQQHPYVSLFVSLLVFLGPWILLLPLFLIQGTFFVVLYILGFGLSGVIGGSPAALYQAFCYGGHTPSASLFAMMQSAGASYNGGTVNNGVLVWIRAKAAVVGAYVLFGIILAEPRVYIK